jgi:hypothetical protein
VLLSLTISNEILPNEPYWNKLVKLFGEFDIHQVLENAEVKRHCQMVVTQNDRYVGFLREHTRLNQQVSITDFRPFNNPPGGNRFLVYSLFPESAVNVRIRYEDPDKDIIVVNVGHSIFNPKCNVNVGLMLARYEGGGHRGAGSTRLPVDKADEAIRQIIDCLVKNENNER